MLLPSESSALTEVDEQARQKHSRLLWWLQPKVALPLLVFVVLLLSPFLYRGYRISQVPEIGEPFDLEAFGTVNIAEADNAMTVYARASAMFHADSAIKSEELDEAFSQGWEKTSERLRKWLDDNQTALAEWRKGTELSQAVVIQPKDFRFTSTLEIIHQSREFVRLALLQAEKCFHEGDVEAAWGWLLACVRVSRHVEQNGCLIQRLVGIALLNQAADGINRWAANPAVTPDLLRKALADFRKADELTPPHSVAMKVEYLVLRNTLRETKSFHELLDVGGSGPGSAPPAIQLWALYFMGDPELSLNAFQHVFANCLSEIDKPKRQRASPVGRFHLYDLPSGTSRCLPANRLEKAIDSARLARLTLPAYAQADQVMQREEAKRAVIPVMLACQLYFRLHGDWPAKVEDLVPEILEKNPDDPLGKSGELLRLKRDVDDLLIYSVGINGTDDGGNLFGPSGSSTSDSPDLGLRIKRPTGSSEPPR